MTTPPVGPPDLPYALPYELPDTYRHVYSGKVRDLWEAPDGRLLFVASDRISAYDHVLSTTIPDKGRILTALSLWWVDRLSDLAPDHVLSTAVPSAVTGRAVICERLDMIPLECVARGYLAGSGLVEYRAKQSICGVGLPPGLKDGSLLPKPIFTPATKAAVGEHDVNVTFDEAMAMVGQEEAQAVRRLSLAMYDRAAGISRDRGLLLADTKFEFGQRSAGTIVLADEVLTPDSSRFWDLEGWAPGGPQRSYDKQYVRDWLTSEESGWDKESDTPPPPLPDHVVEATRARYIEAYERLTARTWL